MSTMYPSGTDSEWMVTDYNSSQMSGDTATITIRFPVIGVIGYGIVGRAVANGFDKHGYEVIVNDIEEMEVAWPQVYGDKKMIMGVCKFVFICVDTPYRGGTFDMRNVFTVCEQLNMYANTTENKPIIVIKSTVLPGTTNELEQRFPDLQFAVNPEFLREKYAEQDFLKPDRIVLGSNSPATITALMYLYDTFDCKHICSMQPQEAELVKFLSNAFLTLKVAFAVSVQSVCDMMNINADLMMRAVTLDRRINPSHMTPSLGQIPIDSRCLPKDLLAFKDFVASLGLPTRFFKQIYKTAVEPE